MADILLVPGSLPDSTKIMLLSLSADLLSAAVVLPTGNVKVVRSDTLSIDFHVKEDGSWEADFPQEEKE